MHKYLILAATVQLAVLGADLTSHPVILLEAEEHKPVADESSIDSSEISKAQKISASDAYYDAID